MAEGSGANGGSIHLRGPMKWVVTVDQIGAKSWGIIGEVVGEVEAANVIDAKARASVQFSPRVKQALNVQSRISWRYDQEARKELDTRERRRFGW